MSVPKSWGEGKEFRSFGNVWHYWPARTTARGKKSPLGVGSGEEMVDSVHVTEESRQ